MKTDRELLELAAKAAGLTLKPMEVKNVEFHGDDRFIGYMVDPEEWRRGWFNPIENDSDALRLAVTLKLDVCFYNGFQEVGVQGDWNPEPVEANEPYGADIYAAARRAIVRAAAAIGDSMND